MKRKNRIICTVIILCCLAVMAAAFFSHRFPGKCYGMAVRVQAMLDRSKKLEIEKITAVSKDGEGGDLRVKEMTVEEALSDPRCVWTDTLMLINSEHPLPEGFEPEIAVYAGSDVSMNVCMMEDYQALAKEVKERFGQSLYVRSAFRTEQMQQEAVENEGEKAAPPGASEHQAGLALDVYVPYFAGSGFLNCEAGRWVNSNCGKYGFIIRYPAFGEEKTGFGYEPWHLRYVGMPHAELIMENHLTLEEYADCFETGVFYRCQDYIISRQEPGMLLIPQGYEKILISPDNQGSLFVTASSADTED